MSLPRPQPLCEPRLRGALQDVGAETCMLPAQPALAEAWFLQLRLPNPGPRLLGGKSKSHTPVTAAATTQAPGTSSLGVSEQKPECFWAKPQHAAHFFSLPMMLCEWVPGLFLLGCWSVARREKVDLNAVSPYSYFFSSGQKSVFLLGSSCQK